MADVRERDLVLSPNEFAFVLDKTKGLISSVVGPFRMSLSDSDSLVKFNANEKRFEEANSPKEVIQTFVSAPENWYIELKNPTTDDKHPTAGTSNSLASLNVGKKVNIKGNASFALFPGQMAKVIQGHRLHSNQYLLARVYDADVLDKEEVDILDEEGEPTGQKVQQNKYVVGQMLVIKGTEVPFYIPPTGIEVMPIGGKEASGTKVYVRDAVTLERLEYCILKDEEGNKTYIHGAAVVFPRPDQKFLVNHEDKSYKFRAIELSNTSGIYVKVIADYEENGKQYKTGEELFITGNDSMIYYPRPEHAIIQYDGKVLHHAIEIPEGEGRYVLDRNTGKIDIVKGPTMYLPDPRDKVIVRRRLSKKQCEMWYPGNEEVLKYNVGNDDAKNRAKARMSAFASMSMNSSRSSYDVSEDEYDGSYDDVELDEVSELDNGFLGNAHATVESSNIKRESDTSPRTIELKDKYSGVVSIDIWTGYAINVIPKVGQRRVVVGPCTTLLAYDETLEIMELSTGKPKTTDNLLKTAYLRVDNNKISDIFTVQTKDYVNVTIKVSYCVDFLESHKNKWFSIENYVKYMVDRERSLVKNKAKLYDVEEFYSKATDIVRNIALDVQEATGKPNDKFKNREGRGGRFFPENGMLVHDIEVLSVKIDCEIQDIIDEHQQSMIEKSLELSKTKREAEVVKELNELEKTRETLQYEIAKYKEELKYNQELEKFNHDEQLKRLREKSSKTEHMATRDLQVVKDAIQKSELERKKKASQQEIDFKKKSNELAIEREKAYTESMSGMLATIGDELSAAMNFRANADLLKEVSRSMSPLAIANGDESVADTVRKLTHGTSLEEVVDVLRRNVDRTADEL